VDHNGYRIHVGPRGEQTIRHRESGYESRLTVSADGEDGYMVFDNDNVRVTLGSDYTVQAMELKQPFDWPEGHTLSLREAAAMHVVLKGISESLPHLTLE
jgi:hypothetical protein